MSELNKLTNAGALKLQHASATQLQARPAGQKESIPRQIKIQIYSLPISCSRKQRDPNQYIFQNMRFREYRNAESR